MELLFVMPMPVGIVDIHLILSAYERKLLTRIMQRKPSLRYQMLKIFSFIRDAW